MPVPALARDPTSKWEEDNLNEIKWEMGRLKRRTLTVDCPWCGLADALFCTNLNHKMRLVVRCDECRTFVREKKVTTNV